MCRYAGDPQTKGGGTSILGDAQSLTEDSPEQMALAHSALPKGDLCVDDLQPPSSGSLS